MKNKIKVIIADDNENLCFLINKCIEKDTRFEVLGIANTDEEEIKMIEELKPDIVITDLMREKKYSGLEIIKEYYKKEHSIKFLVISSDKKEFVLKDVEVAGYIEKGFKFNFNEILTELERISKLN